MFAIHIVDQNGRRPDRRSLAERLFGKLLGFCAGLVLIAAIDALFLNHLLRQSIGDGLTQSMPGLVHTLRSGWANVAGR